jgi:hypothetical protein
MAPPLQNSLITESKDTEAGRMAQVAEHLLSKCEAWSLNPSSTKQTNKQINKHHNWKG